MPKGYCNIRFFLGHKEQEIKCDFVPVYHDLVMYAEAVYSDVLVCNMSKSFSIVLAL